MKPFNYQIINNRFGKPEYVLVPYDKYLQLTNPSKINLADGVPSELVDLLFDKQYPPAQAWREYLKLTQSECAEKFGMSQPAYLKLEASEKPTTRLATALGINEEQLDC
ncbi:hypothetical protein BHC48_03875 [Snodgrassella communis]|uniref:HTH cro/C1-type domain-containing protein n=1 Tax=Snodgrassella alvi TaxID=1196083 RepID=A0A2N9XS31_9NEIS|nr:hypothetical protein BHC48_03875 [Snodgrassella communis]